MMNEFDPEYETLKHNIAFLAIAKEGSDRRPISRREAQLLLSETGSVHGGLGTYDLLVPAEAVKKAHLQDKFWKDIPTVTPDKIPHHRLGEHEAMAFLDIMESVASITAPEARAVRGLLKKPDGSLLSQEEAGHMLGRLGVQHASELNAKPDAEPALSIVVTPQAVEAGGLDKEKWAAALTPVSGKDRKRYYEASGAKAELLVASLEELSGLTLEKAQATAAAFAAPVAGTRAR